MLDVETETHRDWDTCWMLRPRLIETEKFLGCRDRDSSRLNILEGIKTETHQDSSKGVETETETESLATHCKILPYVTLCGDQETQCHLRIKKGSM